MSKFVLTAFVHAFSAANDVADPLSSGALNNYLGTEVDLVLSYNLAKDINFKAGYSQMFATTTMEAVKGGSKDATSSWGWVMITIKPKFFSTADKKENIN